MRAAVFVLVAAVVSAAPSRAAVRDWPLRGFDRVQLEAPARVTIRAGRDFSVRAEGEPDAIAGLTAQVRDGTLVIGSARKGWLRPERMLHVAIAMPRVAGAGVTQVGGIAVDRAEAPLVAFTVDGTGSIDVASVQADRTILSMRGTGSIDVAGTTRHLDARRSGVGAIDAGRLAARSAVLVSTGVGSLDAGVDGPVSVEKSGMGSVSVTGNPRCTVRKSGMGSVDCGKG